MKKNKEKIICPICENGEKSIKTLSVSDVERLLNAIDSFRHQEEHSCDLEDIEIDIYADGYIKLSAEFKSYYETILKI